MAIRILSDISGGLDSFAGTTSITTVGVVASGTWQSNRLLRTGSSTNSFMGDYIDYGTATGLAEGKLGQLETGGSWGETDASSIAGCGNQLGIKLSNGKILVRGMFRLSSAIGQNGTPLYVSTTSGGFTATAPSGGGEVVRIVGYTADQNGNIYFNPSNDWIEIA